MKLRTRISLYLMLFGMVPLLVSFIINVPMIFDKIEILYHKAHLQNLRAEFGDLDQHLARRHEMVRLLAKMPEPGMFMDGKDSEGKQAAARARKAYVNWVNQVMSDQLDVTQILFLDADGTPEFWLDRDNKTGRLESRKRKHPAVAPVLLEAARTLRPGEVMNGPIIFDRAASKAAPNRFMQLSMVSPVFIPDLSGQAREEMPQRRGSVIVYLDLGGLASAYRGNYWVLGNGQYLPSPEGETRPDSAFHDFPGLQQLFSKHELALWEYGNQQVLWVPLFETQDAGTLWVGRSVDASPLSMLQQTVELRVVLIAIGLMIVVYIVARLIAVRLDRLGQELTDRIARVLERDEEVVFSWTQPRELQMLGQNLTRLAAVHAANTRALHDYAAELEESNRYKSEFLANVSHELRTPLNSILLLSKMLSEGRIPEEQCRQAQVIHDAGADLKALIDNILDLSRIEARQMTLVRETVVLRRLVDQVLELMRPQLDEKHLDLQFAVDPDVPESIVSDGEKIRQVLVNFLSNAVKFTSAGHVRVTLKSGEMAGGVRYPVAIQVADTGIGIATDKLDLVFEAFKQADGSTSRRFGGTGLGLTISRELAWLLGGDIRAESTPGAGSVFTLLLPSELPGDDHSVPAGPPAASRTGRSLAQQIPVADYAGARVLLVDDDMRNLLALTPLLEGWNLRVMAAGDGHEALETLATDGEFRLVFMDIMMPGMDGYETIRLIRQQQDAQELPIIALTAKGGEADQHKCIESGANDCIVKPVDTAELKLLLDKYLATTGDD
jgi:signal transduction histidine kinase/ActR/RegA family two-component response regulator